MRIRRNTAIDAAAILALPWLLFLHPLLNGEIPYFMDTLGQFYPLRAHAAHVLAGGEWPFWNRTMFCGTPLLANPQWGLMYPLGWGMLAWPGPFWFMAEYPLHFGIQCVGVYALARRAGAGRLAGWAAALSLLFCSLTLSRVAFGSFHRTLAWLPWGWLAILMNASAAREVIANNSTADGNVRKATGGLAIVCALQLYAGAPQIAAYCLGSYVIFALAGFFYARPRWKSIIWTFVGIGLGVLLAAPQIVPTYTFLQACERAGGLESEKILQGTLTLRGWIAALWGGSGYPEDAESTAHFGAGWMFLALLGMAGVALKRDPRSHPSRFLVGAATAIFLGAFIYSWSVLAPTWYRILPEYRLFHDPKRILNIVAPALAVLAGLGLEMLAHTRQKRLVAAAVSLSTIATAIGFLTLPPRDMSLPTFPDDFPAFGWIEFPNSGFGNDFSWIFLFVFPLFILFLYALGIAGAKEAKRSYQPAAAIVLMIALSGFQFVFALVRVDLKTTAAASVFPELNSSPENGRLFAFDPAFNYTYDYPELKERVYPNRGSYYGLLDAQGYDALLLKPYAEYLRVANAGGLMLYPSHFGLFSRPASPWLAHLGIRWVSFGPARNASSAVGQVSQITNKTADILDETFFEYKTASPLVSIWFEAAAGDPFSPAALRPERSALIIDDRAAHTVLDALPKPGTSIPLPTTAPAILKRAQWSANTLVAEVETTRTAYLLVREAFDGAADRAGGWSARIDDKAAFVLPAEGLFMAVPFPAGSHTIELTYFPPGLWLGLVLGGLGAALLAIMLLLRPKNPLAPATDIESAP